MNDALSRELDDGSGPQAPTKARTAEPANMALISGGAGQDLAGQAEITVFKPAAGETATYDGRPGDEQVCGPVIDIDGNIVLLKGIASVAAGGSRLAPLPHCTPEDRTTFVVNFDATAAQLSLEGNDLVLTFTDGGRIVFTDGVGGGDGNQLLGSGGPGIQEPDLESIPLLIATTAINPTVVLSDSPAFSQVASNESASPTGGSLSPGLAPVPPSAARALSVLSDLADAGGEVITGDAGDDLLLGDVLSADLAAGDPVISGQPTPPKPIVLANLADGMGWAVNDQLIEEASFANTQEVIDFLQDPANTAAFDMLGESLVDGEFLVDGDATIAGIAGNNTLFGGDGNDAIIDSSKLDLIDAGGADVIALSAADETDTLRYHSLDSAEEPVTGFNAGTPGRGGDPVEISDLLDTGVFPGGGMQGAIDGDYVQLSDIGGKAVVSVDVDGTGAITAFITLNGIDLWANSIDDNLIA